MKTSLFAYSLFLLFMLSGCAGSTEHQTNDSSISKVYVDDGWAQSSVNTVIFRVNSIDSYNHKQVVSYYNEEGNVMLAQRNLDETTWEIQTTPYSGDVTNAHNAISIGFDGDGFLHMVWGLHDAPLQYVRTLNPDDLTLSEPMAMTGGHESSVTYPQFFRLPDGDLLFMYRDGGSGRGNIMLNRYKIDTKEWTTVHHPIIDGGGDLSPYPNPITIDREGGWHLSWNWRDSPNVASNHNIAYAYSPDEGNTWLTSSGEVYDLPIHSENAEIVKEIPQNSDLINQTSMTVDSAGNPIIASYWRSETDTAPQYYIVRFDDRNEEWITHQIGNRTLDFNLSGYGTRRIPIARPLVLSTDDDQIIMIFRDFERGGGVSAAVGTAPDYTQWEITDLDTTNVGLWEPTFDPTIWKNDQVLHLFHQTVGQGEGETLEDVPAQKISVLEWIQ